MQKAYNRLIGQAANMGRKAGYVAALFSKEFGLAPWEVSPRMANLPKRKKGIWQSQAADLWPGFVRTSTDDF